MAQRATPQLNIRSSEARRRVAELVRETGKSATQIVEDAVQAYRPPPPIDDDLPEGMYRHGRLVIFKGDGTPITLEDTNRSIEAGRNRDIWGEEEY